MRIGIITCPRDGHVDYLNSTIASMLQKDTGVFCTDIAVFSDNAETPQMAWPVHHVEPLTKQHDDRRKKDKVIIHRPFLKALRWIADSDGIGIVAEDDIKCASRWASRVKDLSEVCDSVVGSVWIMPLMLMSMLKFSKLAAVSLCQLVRSLLSGVHMYILAGLKPPIKAACILPNLIFLSFANCCRALKTSVPVVILIMNSRPLWASTQ